MAFPVLLDACVLVPYDISDLLLRLASEKTYRPLWSADILRETERALVTKLGMSPEKVGRRLSRMREHFLDAEVEGYEDLIDAMQCEKNDRHVLAAAVRGNASVLVTANLKDFPDAALEPYDIVVLSPDEFLLDQLDLYQEKALAVLRKLVAARRKPPETPATFLNKLQPYVPGFVEEARKMLGVSGSFPLPPAEGALPPPRLPR
ncbi:PIN domain-containing protein [Saccharomonospora xinjiangensis]|uniref:PIN domain-containing protein n=1 Tax=Saccharomonospora xinjiangensis TaxID=75294 RepID=UPI001430C843|nr:PIN domain-containing protein [Saccharomonospora xinjiangensis]